jgi:ABC-type sugar transport system substrate-binding protein
MKIKLMTSGLVMLVLLLSACAQAGTPSTPTGQGASAPERTIRIGMANLSLCCAYFIGMSDAVKQEASVYPNVELIVTDANGEAEKLTSDIEDLIAKKVDGIIISGAWLEAAPAALEAINKAGIPVVLVDRKLKGGEYTSYVGPDNFTIGQQNGRYIAERLGGQGRLVVLRGGPADNSIGLDRTNGVLDIVKQHAGIEVVMAPDFGGWSTDGGLKLMENMLATYDKIDAVFCENDSMCLGAQQAIADAGRTDEMFLVGVDGQKEALVQIMQGTNYAATGLNNSDQIGRAAFHRLMAILAGAKAPKDTILPSPLITKENVQRYYNPDSVF